MLKALKLKFQLQSEKKKIHSLKENFFCSPFVIFSSHKDKQEKFVETKIIIISKLISL
jgi:hypothetical protein